MDALVAEKVMGLVTCADPVGRCDGAKLGLCWAYKPGEAGSELQRYSTDIAAAWQVLEKLRERFEAVAVVSDAQTGPGADPSKGWVCFGQRPHFQAEGVTAPEAICRAALKAVEALVPA